jgi:hypothetical protein
VIRTIDLPSTWLRHCLLVIDGRRAVANLVKENDMTKFLALSALAAALTMSAAADANAWTRSGSATGPHGSWSVQGSGGCADGACNRSVTRTGPYGSSMSRQGTASCANGVCTGSRQTTGPAGQTISRQGSISR